MSLKRQESGGTNTEHKPQVSLSSHYFFPYTIGELPNMAHLPTPKVAPRGSADKSLFWFVQSDDEQGANTEAALDKVVDRIDSDRIVSQEEEHCQRALAAELHCIHG